MNAITPPLDLVHDAVAHLQRHITLYVELLTPHPQTHDRITLTREHPHLHPVIFFPHPVLCALLSNNLQIVYR